MPFLDKNKLILDVSLDALSFVAGTEFSGTATLVVLEATNIRGLMLTYAVAHSRCFGGKSTLIYRQEVSLIGDRSSKKSISYNTGIEQFPFRVSIPAEVPPTMTTSTDVVTHSVSLEAIIPFSWKDLKEEFELHVMRGVSPLQYQFQEPAAVSQEGKIGYSCLDCPCCMQCCFPGGGGGGGCNCLAIDAVNDWQLHVHRPVVSLLNDRTVPVRVSGRITSRCQVALIREVAIKRGINPVVLHHTRPMLRSHKVVVGSFLLPRTPPHISRPVMDIHIPLDFDAIEDMASYHPQLHQHHQHPPSGRPPHPVDGRGLMVNYYATVNVLYDEGCLPSVARSTARVPVTVVHCIHEHAPELVLSPPPPPPTLSWAALTSSGDGYNDRENRDIGGGSAVRQEMQEMIGERSNSIGSSGRREGRHNEGNGLMVTPGLAPPVAPGAMGSTATGGGGGGTLPYGPSARGLSNVTSRVGGEWIHPPVDSTVIGGGNTVPPSWMQDVITLDSHLERANHNIIITSPPSTSPPPLSPPRSPPIPPGRVEEEEEDGKVLGPRDESPVLLSESPGRASSTSNESQVHSRDVYCQSSSVSNHASPKKQQDATALSGGGGDHGKGSLSEDEGSAPMECMCASELPALSAPVGTASKAGGSSCCDLHGSVSDQSIRNYNEYDAKHDDASGVAINNPSFVHEQQPDRLTLPPNTGPSMATGISPLLTPPIVTD